MIRIKRAYDPPERGDGQRFLVERLWPRGMKKEALAADAWLKEVAPCVYATAHPERQRIERRSAAAARARARSRVQSVAPVRATEAKRWASTQPMPFPKSRRVSMK